MGLFNNLGQEDVPRLGSLADREIRERNLKLLLCKKCLLNSNTFRVVPEILIEGINIEKIHRAKICWSCGDKK